MSVITIREKNKKKPDQHCLAIIKDKKISKSKVVTRFQNRNMAFYEAAQAKLSYLEG